MRRAALVPLVLGAATVTFPAPALAASRTSTPLRITAPAPANATVAGFKLALVRAGGASISQALSRTAALPRDVTIYSVVARQRRSDRVSGVLVAVNRAEAVAAGVRAAARTLTVNVTHEPTPRGYRVAVRLVQSANVLNSRRTLDCSRYFARSDLRNARKLAGPTLRGITVRTIVQSACASARSRAPYRTEAAFRAALNARSGKVAFVRSHRAAGELSGTASFNYPVAAFAVQADAKHRFTSCSFSGGTCAIRSRSHADDYAVFRLSAVPAPRGTRLAFTLTVTPSTAPLPFRFFGINQAATRFGPLLTSGP